MLYGIEIEAVHPDGDNEADGHYEPCECGDADCEGETWVDSDDVSDDLRDDVYRHFHGRYSPWLARGQQPTCDAAMLGMVDVVSDGSLPGGGIECKPIRPLAACEMPVWVDGVTRELRRRGYDATDACGLHMHVDRNSMRKATLEVWTVAMAAWAHTAANSWEYAVNPALFGTTRTRLSGEYSQAPTLEELVDTQRTGLKALQNHYRAVSYSSNHRTIELRMAAGTLRSAAIERVWTAVRHSLKVARTGRLDAAYAVFVHAAERCTVTRSDYGHLRFGVTVSPERIELLRSAVYALGEALEREVRASIALAATKPPKPTKKRRILALRPVISNQLTSLYDR